jgi:hypothetical protein
MKHIAAFVLLLAAAIPALAQETAGDQIVSVPMKYVSAEGLSHQQSADANKWIGLGREIGAATREGLNAVVETAEKFGTTKVGTFVMVMIAWKIMAKDVIGIVLGVPLLIGGVCIWIWAMKRLYFGYRIVAEVDGRTKKYADHPPYKFDSSDARTATGIFMFISLAAWVLVMTLAVVF